MLIGLVGKKGSGKDTFANVLKQKSGFITYAYATPLKEACQKLFLLSDEQLHDQTLKETVDKRWDLSPRQIFQIIGTDFIRTHIDSDFWIKHFTLWYKGKSTQNIIVTDCRFQNEIDTIKELGGMIFKIERNTSVEDNHISENGIDNLTNIDIVIKNDSSLEDYHKIINKYCVKSKIL